MSVEPRRGARLFACDFELSNCRISIERTVDKQIVGRALDARAVVQYCDASMRACNPGVRDAGDDVRARARREHA